MVKKRFYDVFSIRDDSWLQDFDTQIADLMSYDMKYEICRMKVHWVDSKKHSPQSCIEPLLFLDTWTHQSWMKRLPNLEKWDHPRSMWTQPAGRCVLLATLLRPMSYLGCFWSNKYSKHLEQIPSSDKHKENSFTKKKPVKLLNSPASKSSSSAAIVNRHWVPFALSFKGFQ